MKELRELRTQLEEHVTDPAVRGVHLYPPGYSPPNILILKRKTVRAFNSAERVALYYSDKLQRYFSVPFTVGREDDSIDDVVGVSEEALNEISIPVAKKAYHTRQNRGVDAMNKGDYKTALPQFHKALKTQRLLSKKYERDDKGETVKEAVIQEDAVSHLKKVVAFKTSTPLYHKNGTQTKIDPQTANALLTVHGSLHPDNQKKFNDSCEHSKEGLAKMIDFAWKNVKS